MATQIRIQGLGIEFLRYASDHFPTLKHAAMRVVKGVKAAPAKFWALRDINLQFERGDRVGIIGRNGAGKSTLLKSITGIYPPIAGSIEVCGRVVPLLELGAGFMDNRTVEENIFLMGAIFGRSKREMAQALPGILAFSELEAFADTLLVNLSSGMRSRLAFSIATSFQPEILLLDEIFAAGDAQFVQKARERMSALIQSSHILLFVSHDEELVKEFCNRAILLDHGEVRRVGTPAEAYDYYHREILEKT